MTNPTFDEVYAWAGKCLSSWNMIEDEVCRLVSYGCSSYEDQPIELSIGYWAVISFEARLKWCDSVVRFRMRFHGFEELAAKWNNLNSQLTEKSKQRAKVAHGTVVGFESVDGKSLPAYLIPYFHSKKLKFNLQSMHELVEKDFSKEVEKLSTKELQEMRTRFAKLRNDLADFLLAWEALDKEKGLVLRGHE